jgi:hypothetical protein
MPVTIRASSLSGYADCPRRTAANIFKGEIEEAGYILLSPPLSIGAAVGTAMHAGAAYSMTEKKNTGHIGNNTEAEQIALEVLDLTVEQGITWDKEAENINSAQKQTLSLLKACREHVVPHITPVEVEVRLEAKVSEEFILSGQVDINEEYGLVDWKSGKKRRANGPQYGAYSLLARSHGKENKKATEVYIQRVREGKEQPLPKYHIYDVAVAENSAISVLKHIEKDLAAFRESGNAREFLANPSSMLCSEKFCPAWGTGFCKEYIN